MIGTASGALRSGVLGAAQSSSAPASVRGLPLALHWSPASSHSLTRRGRHNRSPAVRPAALPSRCIRKCSNIESESESTGVAIQRAEAHPTRRAGHDAERWSPPDLFCVALGASVGLALLHPGGASAAEGMIPLDLFKGFLDEIETLGPLGGVAFTVCVILAEMIPLFPTQPLALAAGLLFGPVKGAGLVLTGNVGAAAAAFLLARGVGRPLAEKVIQHEMDGEEGTGGNPILSAVEDAIENGSISAQFVSIFFMRLTPVVPFSASNYVLGLSPFPFLPFVGGTLVGMAPWAFLFGTLGGAGRSLLDGGEDLGQVFADLAGQASEYTEEAALVGGGLALAAAGVWGVTKLRGGGSGGEGQQAEAPAEAEVLRVEKTRVKEKAVTE